MQQVQVEVDLGYSFATPKQSSPFAKYETQSIFPMVPLGHIWLVDAPSGDTAGSMKIGL